MRRLCAILVLSAACAAQEKPMPKHTNRLAKEKSPYLLQHAHNPVDWFPWGPEAFEKAKKEDKPIFLSIGYSTCHWCHVMEHESFEDEGVAKILNEHFVPIKVDREERPDVDQIYMAAVQGITGGGGWPLSAWLTPDLKPFMGGTYFPKEDKFGRRGFTSILNLIVDYWKDKRADVDESAKKIAEQIAAMSVVEVKGAVDPAAVLKQAFDLAKRTHDEDNGGFSQAPKFPHSTTVSMLLRIHARTGDKEALAISERTLLAMAKGGLYDQLGGGFHRYSTDARWIVPHFEKMLYDNALLAACYLEAWQVTKNDFYARIARETLDYVLRDMTSKEGGFYSAEDADSEGIEGKFYVWNPKQLQEVLGADAAEAARVLDITPGGNWDPHEESIPKKQSVLRVIAEGNVDVLKKRMFEARAKRVRPHLDDKVLTSWNALMISAMAQAAQALGEAKYRDAAARAAAFLLSVHRKDGKLLRTSRLGEAKIDAFLEDYAYLAAAMLDLYETTFEAKYFDEARRLVGEAIDGFWDDAAGGFFVSGKGHEALIARMREEYEGPVPTANSVLALTLLRLHAFTGEAAYRERAEKTIGSFKAHVERWPVGHAWMVCAIDRLQGPSKEIVIAGPDPEPFLKAIRTRYLPNKVVALADGKAKLPLLEGRTSTDGKTLVYVCENMACKRPVSTVADLEALLK